MGGALREFPIIYIWLSLDEEKALRKVKEVFRISRRSFQIWTVPMAATAPVTKVYNHDFATRVASMGYLKHFQKIIFLGGYREATHSYAIILLFCKFVT